MAGKVALAVDLGGSFIKAGAVDEQGKIVREMKVETRAAEGVDAVVGRIETLVESLLEGLAKGNAVTGIGVGCPGLTDVEKGVVRFAPNLAGWDEVHLGERLSRRFGLPVLVENDANAAAWGEYWMGAGKGASSLVLFTLGTGIGGGVVLNGEVWHGYTDTAAELGHMIVEAEGEPCGCGNRGCLEAYASVTGLRRRAGEAVKAGEKSVLRIEEGKLSGEDVYKAALSADRLAARLMRDVGYYLGVATVSVMHILNPEKVLFAGGLAGAGEMIMKPIREVVTKRALPVPRAKASIGFASLGERAGLVGVAGCVFHKYGTSA